MSFFFSKAPSTSSLAALIASSSKAMQVQVSIICTDNQGRTPICGSIKTASSMSRFTQIPEGGTYCDPILLVKQKACNLLELLSIQRSGCCTTPWCSFRGPELSSGEICSEQATVLSPDWDPLESVLHVFFGNQDWRVGVFSLPPHDQPSDLIMFRLQGRWVAALVTQFIDGFGVPNHPSFGGQGAVGQHLGYPGHGHRDVSLEFFPTIIKEKQNPAFPGIFPQLLGSFFEVLL